MKNHFIIPYAGNKRQEVPIRQRRGNPAPLDFHNCRVNDSAGKMLFRKPYQSLHIRVQKLCTW